jgi:DNA mismatch repair ATPase MutS
VEPSGDTASRKMRRLESLAGFAALRHSALVHVVANAALSWDVLCAVALDRWRARHGREVSSWLEALSELEALASLATFAYEHASFAWPTVADGEARFSASDLAHPLIPSRQRVGNDVRLEPPVRALMITGSNMSGKSTMLRSIGIAAVLAQAGAPVCARALTMSALRVCTSMRVDDSLAEGASHFYNEVRRLKRVLDALATPGAPPLFLLDEVLHGTNSRERNLGAKAVVRHLVDHGAIGAVSSHDLGLCELEELTGGKIVNTHFEDQLKDAKADQLSFDYRMKPGPVGTSNALRLMRQVGIAIVPEG